MNQLSIFDQVPEPEIKLNSTVTPAAAPRLGRQQLEILARLKRGPVRNTELTQIALRYSARLQELRVAGWEISKRAISEERGVFEYALVSEERRAA